MEQENKDRFTFKDFAILLTLGYIFFFWLVFNRQPTNIQLLTIILLVA